MEFPVISPVTPSVTSYGKSWKRHFGETLQLGLPLIGAQIAQLAINTTDVLIVGRLGTVELAAIVLASQYFFTIFVFGSGFSTALIPLVAHALGTGSTREVRRSTRMGFWVSLAFALLAMPLFWNSYTVLLWLGQKPDVAAYASSYLKIVGFGLFPALLFMCLRALLSATSRTSIILYVTLMTVVMNAVLAYIFVPGHFGAPAFGIKGAAVIAVLVNLTGFLVAAVYVTRVTGLKEYELFARFWRPEWTALVEVIRHGVPVGLMVLAEVSLFTVASIMMGWLGTLQLAAHGIALQFASMTFMIPLGLSQAATVRVGLAAGRGDGQSILRAGLAAVILSMGFATISGAVLIVERNALALLFLDRSDPDMTAVLAIVGPFIIIAGAFQLFDGLQAVGAGLCRGVKDSTIPMVLAIFSYWGIGFSAAYILAFPLGFGGIGIWLGFLFGLGTAAIVLTIRFFLLAKRYQ